ncbi:MAG TPA: hypothetical protein VGM91_23440 [Conexibacter sp.]|jgi:hypothetical protein
MASLVPVNLTASTLQSNGAPPPPAPPTADALDDWSQENYTLTLSGAASLGFPVGNSVSGSGKHQVLLFGSSRSTDVRGKDGDTYRFGVALRALVVVSDIKGSGSLTLPVVAAKVEIENARASAQLLIRGYKGADLELPSWQSFGVDSYAKYMQDVSELQDKIMSDTANIVPALLATTIAAPALPSTAGALGSVYALDAIARGASLTHAMDQLKSDDKQVRDTVRAVYDARVGEGERAEPDDDARDGARNDLGEIRLSHGLFERH